MSIKSLGGMHKDDKKTDIKVAYAKLAKKYALPEYESLNQDFEIETLEEMGFLLRNIRNKISEKMEFCIKLLANILQPEQNITDLQECKMFNDEQKKKIYLLYKNLMASMRSAGVLSISSTEKEEAAFLTAFYAEWSAKNGYREQLKKVLQTLKDSWTKETDVEAELGYMG